MKLKIFTSGVQTLKDGTAFDFTPEIVKEIAETYDPEFYEAPVVIGHPKTNAPAFAWVKGLSYEAENDGSAKLIAVIGDATPEFSELVTGKYFKNISSAFYPPQSTSNPKPEKWYMRHLGMLGAQPPAIKGLSKLEFAAGDDYEAFEFADDYLLSWSLKSIFQKMREWFIASQNIEVADDIVPQYLIDNVDRALDADAPQFSENTPDDNPNMEDIKMAKATNTSPAAVADGSQDELAAQKAALEAREAAVAAKEAAFAESQNLNEAKSFVLTLEENGQITPAMKAGLPEFIAGLNGDDANAFEFAEGDEVKKQSPKAYFKGLLSNLPKLVEFAEISAGEGKKAKDLDAEAYRDLAVEFMEAEGKKGNILTISQAMSEVQARLENEGA